MKVAITLLAFVAFALSDKLTGNEPVPIISQSAEVNPDGSYHLSYETGNGISAQESGELKNRGNSETEAEQVQGSYQYTAPNGQVIRLTYDADENGFRAQGDHLPTPPPAPEIPAYILRSLEYIRTHPQPEKNLVK